MSQTKMTREAAARNAADGMDAWFFAQPMARLAPRQAQPTAPYAIGTHCAWQGSMGQYDDVTVAGTWITLDPYGRPVYQYVITHDRPRCSWGPFWATVPSWELQSL